MNAHFFEGVNWDRVYDRAIPAPIVPSLTYRRRESGKPARTNSTGDATQSAARATESEATGGDALKSKLAPAVILAHATVTTNTHGVLFSDALSSSSSSSSSATTTAAAAVTATEQVTEAADPPTAGQSAPSTPSTQSESDELMNLRGKGKKES